jgi:membrane protease YdiL (CAAX protease family)
MSVMKDHFVNPDENRLRAGWRVFLFLVAAFLVATVVNGIIKTVFGGPPSDKTVSIVVRGLIVIVNATLVVGLMRRYIDKKSFVSLGLRFDGSGMLDLLVGLVLSGLMVGIIFVLLLYFGLLEIKEVGWTGSGIPSMLGILLWLFGIGLAVGWSEELAFRGYLLQNLREGIGMVWAVILSCILYGIVHMLNPNSTLLSGMLIAVIGFLRIFGWLRSGQLWLSMGMHTGWNFFQGPIFGFQVSGTHSEVLIKHTLTGQGWITGGPFGPEAGIIVVPMVLFALLVMFLWTTKRENTPWLEEKKRAA